MPPKHDNDLTLKDFSSSPDSEESEKIAQSDPARCVRIFQRFTMSTWLSEALKRRHIKFRSKLSSADLHQVLVK